MIIFLRLEKSVIFAAPTTMSMKHKDAVMEMIDTIIRQHVKNYEIERNTELAAHLSKHYENLKAKKLRPEYQYVERAMFYVNAAFSHGYFNRKLPSVPFANEQEVHTFESRILMLPF